jgi:hypothetical protein
MYIWTGIEYISKARIENSIEKVISRFFSWSG